MPTPTLPSYLGSWDELVNSLIHDPFLGGGRSPGHQPRIQAMLHDGAPARSELDGTLPIAGPSPQPWRFAAASLVALTATRQVARHVVDERLRSEMMAEVDQSVRDVLDDICGTPSHWPPRPPFGLGSDASTVISALGVAAQSFSDQAMRDDLLETAAQLAQLARAATTTQIRER